MEPKPVHRGVPAPPGMMWQRKPCRFDVQRDGYMAFRWNAPPIEYDLVPIPAPSRGYGEDGAV